MSNNVFEFVAENRELSGKIAARAARRNGLVPAVVYGGGDAQSINLNHNEVLKHLAHEAVYSHVLDLNIDGKIEKAVLKAVQRHPAKPKVLHLDFMRVDETQELKVNVPIHFMNEIECVGVKAGGVITHSMVDVEVLCLPAALPEFIEVDLAGLEMGGSVHLSDLVLPEGVQIIELAHGDDHDLVVAQVMKTRGEKEEDESDVDVESDEES